MKVILLKLYIGNIVGRVLAEGGDCQSLQSVIECLNGCVCGPKYISIANYAFSQFGGLVSPIATHIVNDTCPLDWAVDELGNVVRDLGDGY